MSEQGEQYRCPQCFTALGTPEMDAEGMERIKARHQGSKKCEERRERLQFALSHMATEKLSESVIIEEHDGELDALVEAVVFESPTRFLRVRLRRAIKRWSPQGDLLDEEPARWAEFYDGRFSTSDPWTVKMLRSAPNNAVNLKRRLGRRAGDLNMQKDRFYEVGAVPNLRAEPGDPQTVVV